MTESLPIIWTAGGIGQFLRLGNDGVYALAQDPSVPIYKAGNRLYAFEDELTAWMKRRENRAGLQKPTTPEDSRRK